MRGCIYNTDYDWYRYLAARQPEEVNFWRPAASQPSPAVSRSFFKLTTTSKTYG